MAPPVHRASSSPDIEGLPPAVAPPEILPDLDPGLDRALVVTSHEFRGPLLAVELTLERILITSALESEERRLLLLAVSDLRRVLSSMDDVLRWSAGRRLLRRRRTELKRLLVDVANRCQRESPAGRIHVRGEPTYVAADGPLLRCALASLMRNALAYGGAAPLVRVTLHRSTRGVTIAVHDDGPGIPRSESDVIFAPYVRGRRSALRGSGRGLGLHIAQRIVQAHGGNVRLVFGRPGTTFHVRLPVEGA
jgi:two-component system, OmpR family, sensor kinase